MKCVHGHMKRKSASHTITHTCIYVHTHRDESSKNTRVIISAVFEVLDCNHLILICCLLPREEKKGGKERQRDGGKLRDKGGNEKKRGSQREMEEMRRSKRNEGKQDSGGKDSMMNIKKVRQGEREREREWK